MIDTSCDIRGRRLRGQGSTWHSVFVLVIAAAVVLGAAACAGDGDDDEEDDSSVDEPADDAADSAELDEAIERANAAEAERDALQSEVDALQFELDEIEEADPEALAAMEEALATVEDQRALAQLQLEATTQRAEAAEARVAEVEDIAGQFPISLDSSLIPDDMPGAYRIDFQEAYCEGFGNCGTERAPTDASLYFTSEGFLRVGVEGVLDAGLFALDGSLYGITDSLTALPPCGENERRARITVTLYAGSISVLEDGARVVNDLNASITIDAPADGPDCPAGLAFYASSLVPAT